MAEIGRPGPPTTLHIQRGVDRDFDIEWFEEDGETAVPIVSVVGLVEAIRGDVVDTALDLATVTTIVAGVAQVRIPAAETALWDFEDGKWFLTITDGQGRVKLAFWGPVETLVLDHG